MRASLLEMRDPSLSSPSDESESAESRAVATWHVVMKEEEEEGGKEEGIFRVQEEGRN